MSDDNRHARKPRVLNETNAALGFIVTVLDDEPDIEGIDPVDSVDIQLKPHPNGYQIDCWFTDEDGQRQSATAYLNPAEDA